MADNYNEERPVMEEENSRTGFFSFLKRVAERIAYPFQMLAARLAGGEKLVNEMYQRSIALEEEEKIMKAAEMAAKKEKDKEEPSEEQPAQDKIKDKVEKAKKEKEINEKMEVFGLTNYFLEERGSTTAKAIVALEVAINDAPIKIGENFKINGHEFKLIDETHAMPINESFELDNFFYNKQIKPYCNAKWELPIADNMTAGDVFELYNNATKYFLIENEVDLNDMQMFKESFSKAAPAIIETYGGNKEDLVKAVEKINDCIGASIDAYTIPVHNR